MQWLNYSFIVSTAHIIAQNLFFVKVAISEHFLVTLLGVWLGVFSSNIIAKKNFLE
jgi:hypothetical protein